MFNKLQTGSTESKQVLRQRVEGPAAQVLLKMQLAANKFNIIKGTPAQLAKDWALTDWEFRQGMQELKRLDLVRKYTKKEYMINPGVIFNGHDHHEFVVRHMWEQQTIEGIRK